MANIIDVPGQFTPREYGVKLAKLSDIDNNVYGPYESVAAAHTALSAISMNVVGVTAGIVGANNTIVEYWYQGGTAQANLVEKKQNVVDLYPTENSQNPVSSNGVFSDLTGIGRAINQLLSIEGIEIENPDNRVAPSDFKSGDIFYVEDGSYSRYVNGIRYYIAKVDGEAGVSLNNSNLFYNTFSRIEAVRKSNSMKSVSVTVEQELSDTQQRRAQENIGIEEYATADQIHALFS